jgi:Uma2 family endonuclease
MPVSGDFMGQRKKTDRPLTVAEYLLGENDGELRHEFLNGTVHAMAGTTERHNTIKLNVAGRLNLEVAAECRVFDGDMKLHLNDAHDARFYYPDIFVSSGANNDTQYFRTDAAVVFEVLSQSTERYDRYEKFEAYKRIPGLLEYVLIEQRFPEVEVYRRRANWAKEVFEPDALIVLESIMHTLSFEQIYRRVSFAPATGT